MKKNETWKKWAAGLFLPMVVCMSTMPFANAATANSTQPYAQVRRPESNIVLSPSLATVVDSTETVNNLSETAPTTAIITVNAALKVTTPDGASELSDVPGIMTRLDGKIMPAFAVKDTATVDALTTYLKDAGIEDAFVLSTDAAVVAHAREAMPMLRGIVDFTAFDGDTADESQLMDMRRTTNTSGSKIALLPEKLATKANVEYLQKRLITVWISADDNALTKTTAVRTITSGTDGIVSAKRELFEECFQTVFDSGTLVRLPFVIGHRGNPSQAPENTLESAILAVENGAEIVECDIYITRDNELVILHDGTLQRTTNGSGSIEALTLEQVKKLVANKSFSEPSRFADVRVPTLCEYFEEFRGKDVQIFIELKSKNSKVIPEMVKLIDEYQIENQVSVISFENELLTQMRQEMPSMSTGLLCADWIIEADPEYSLEVALDASQKFATTFNPSYKGLSQSFLEMASYRGLTVWPWTYRSEDVFQKAFLMGIKGLTTDNAEYAKEYTASIDANIASTEISKKGTTTWKLDATSYGGLTEDVTSQAQIVMLEGQDLITVGNDGQITAGKTEGTAHFVVKYVFQNTKGMQYTMYTQPLSVTVRGGSSLALVVGATVIGGVLVAGAVLATAIAVIKKKSSKKSNTQEN